METEKSRDTYHYETGIWICVDVDAASAAAAAAGMEQHLRSVAKGS